MRKQRCDVLIHILTDKVEKDFRRMEARVKLGFQASNLSRVEMKSRDEAESVDSGSLEDMVTEVMGSEDGNEDVQVRDHCFALAESKLRNH